MRVILLPSFRAASLPTPFSPSCVLPSGDVLGVTSMWPVDSSTVSVGVLVGVASSIQLPRTSSGVIPCPSSVIDTYPRKEVTSLISTVTFFASASYEFFTSSKMATTSSRISWSPRIERIRALGRKTASATIQPRQWPYVPELPGQMPEILLENSNEWSSARNPFAAGSAVAFARWHGTTLLYPYSGYALPGMSAIPLQRSNASVVVVLPRGCLKTSWFDHFLN